MATKCGVNKLHSRRFFIFHTDIGFASPSVTDRKSQGLSDPLAAHQYIM